jgi:glycosyltransferase involved in cell wall biosynthesis
MVKLSVVMAVYNGAAELEETLASILAQTERDFEFIVVDDGSTDATPSMLAAQTDPRIRVITQENQGLTRALIRGCAEARGTYIARQDCGDISLPTRLEKQCALLDRSRELAFVSCWSEAVGPELEPLYVVTGSGLAHEPLELIDLDAPHGVVDGPTAHPTVVMGRDAYERAGGYRAEFRLGQDWDLWYRLADVGRFQLVPEVLYRYRITPGGLSAASREAQQEFAKQSEALRRARRRGESDAAILERACNVPQSSARASRADGLYFIAEALRRNGDTRARRYFRQALAAEPFSGRAWLRYLQSLMLR